jgi:hypothetical protein
MLKMRSHLLSGLASSGGASYIKSLMARFPKGSNDLKQSTHVVCGFYKFL